MAYLRRLRSVHGKRNAAVFTAVIGAVAVVVAAALSAIISRCPAAAPPTATATSATGEASTATPTQPAPTHISKVGSWVVTTRPIEDEQGHKGVVEVFVLSNDYAWKCKSSEVVGLGGQPEDMQPHLQAAPMQERLRTKHALIAIGTASYEGENREKQELLASSRAQRLVLLLRNNFSGELPPTYTLNLGQYSAKGRAPKRCSDVSERERPVVLLGLIAQDPTFSVPGALTKAFAEPDFPLSRADYSKFDISRKG